MLNAVTDFFICKSWRGDFRELIKNTIESVTIRETTNRANGLELVAVVNGCPSSEPVSAGNVVHPFASRVYPDVVGVEEVYPQQWLHDFGQKKSVRKRLLAKS